jgi:glutathione S-transferase
MAHITLFTSKRGPNGWKVAMLLQELGIEYENKFLDIENGEHKQPDFLKYNPNGRIPAIIDHKNNDHVVWESGAILYYLAKKYDTEHKFLPAKLEDETDVLTWVAFQISGLGPMQGQLFWFKFRHAEKIPSTVERYLNESYRLYSVLNGQLEGKEYINGTFSISDIAFYPWVSVARYAEFDVEGEWKKAYPNVYAWWKRVESRPATQRAYKDQN